MNRKSPDLMKAITFVISTAVLAICGLALLSNADGHREGKHLFESETFDGNGRTCLTCHSSATGTVSPADAQKRFLENPLDPLFLHDGSDDGLGNGVTRMLNDATVRVEVPLHPSISLADDPNARSVVLIRGIPTTLNTPALDLVLMQDGRAPDLLSQAENAIRGHAQGRTVPTKEQIAAIAQFEQSYSFFTSAELRRFSRGGPKPVLPAGMTASEKRGRRFFEDVPIGKDNAGVCAVCHSGPMLNETNQFIPVPVPRGTRFESAFVSQLNKAKNRVRDFIFTLPDGSKKAIQSPDPGRALITGDLNDVNDFKIPTLYGIRHTAPYFHDNSAKTLEDVVTQYKEFFEIITDPDGPGGADPQVILSEQDQADIVAFLKLLN